MTFKELLETVAFADVWKEMQEVYSWKEGAYEAYLKVFNQLKELEQKLSKNRGKKEQILTRFFGCFHR